MQPEMSRHLIFWQDLWPTRWQSMWMECIQWCRVVPTTIWAKITYTNIIKTACRIFVLVWHCLFWEAVPSVAQMQKSKLGTNIFHIWCPIWVGFLFHEGKATIVHNLTKWIWKKLVHMLLAPWKKGYVPKWPMWLSNFEVIPKFWEQFICHPHNILWQSHQLSNFFATIVMVVKQKIANLSLVAPPPCGWRPCSYVNLT